MRVNDSETVVSTTKVQSGCSCKMLAGTCSVTSPSAALVIISPLLPNAINKMRFDCMMVPIPMVTARRGTFDKCENSYALASLVLLARFTSLVFEMILEPGSLKPICPFPPIPKICKSIPPAFIIAASYSAQCFLMSSFGHLPLGI